MLAARTPEAPEQIAFSDSRWIPITWSSGSQPFFPWALEKLDKIGGAHFLKGWKPLHYKTDAGFLNAKTKTSWSLWPRIFAYTDLIIIDICTVVRAFKCIHSLTRISMRWKSQHYSLIVFYSIDPPNVRVFIQQVASEAAFYINTADVIEPMTDLKNIPDFCICPMQTSPWVFWKCVCAVGQL